LASFVHLDVDHEQGAGYIFRTFISLLQSDRIDGARSRVLRFVLVAGLAFSSSAAKAIDGTEIGQAIADCERKVSDACGTVGLAYSDPANDQYDIFLSLRFLQEACRGNHAASCGRLALVYLEGSEDIEADRATAGRFAIKGCSLFDKTACEVAETVFAEASSDQFDAEKALRYRRVNCDQGGWRSCEDLARIYYNLGEFAPAEQVAAKACDPAHSEQRSVCEFAAGLRQRRQEIEQALAERHEAQRRRLAERERASQVVQSFLGQGKYDSAIYAAIYHSRQLADARIALEATLQAGALGSVYKDHLYVLDYWFPSGRLNAAVNAEIERRSRGDDCGIYNCTNMPGASSRRWAAGAGRTAASRSSSSASSFQPARMKSAAEISRETRSRYRTAHCTMNNNANRYLCN